MKDDDLVERLRGVIVQLSAERDRLTAQLESTLKDRAAIIAERDRTFALMLARAEAAEAERDSYLKALENIIADCEADYRPSHGAIKYAVQLALKGETNE